ncbi:hypothetical protein Fmac_018132 [Flemingia macrophylla]|uniref:Topoisomerase I C-terminal domain-containing protein n=1 Tax=Flemingia macrophylla TaxID=520843 RepID=A0ABD1M444_9FABA
MLKIAAILDEARSSYATHNRKLRELSLLRSKSPSPSHLFFDFSKTLTPLFDFHRRLASADRVVSFVSTFAAATDDEFLDHFLKFLIAAATASNKTTRYRAWQITKEDLKTVALGTSKINYLDPRITVAWCKRHEVPIEKMMYIRFVHGLLRLKFGFVQ